MAVPQKLCGDPKLSTSIPNHHYTEIQPYWSYELFAWNARFTGSPINLSTNLYYQWVNGSLLTGTAFLTMPTKSQLTAWNNTPDELNTRLILGKGTLRWLFESQWPATHWGHCDLKVSRNYPDPTCLAPQKCGICRLSSRLIGSPMATTTLHTSSIPPWGMLQFSTRRMGTNPASPVITNWFCLYPSQQVCTTLSILLQNPI